MAMITAAMALKPVDQNDSAVWVLPHLCVTVIHLEAAAHGLCIVHCPARIDVDQLTCCCLLFLTGSVYWCWKLLAAVLPANKRHASGATIQMQSLQLLQAIV